MNSYPQGSNQQKSEDNSGLFTALAGCLATTTLGVKIAADRAPPRYTSEQKASEKKRKSKDEKYFEKVKN